MIELLPDQIWLVDYPIRYAGCDFDARMTVVRLSNGGLWLHSPCEITQELGIELRALGDVTQIVGPGNFHWFHLKSAQTAFPDAQLHICPGIERKVPDLAFDWILGDRPPAAWEVDFDQVLVRGTRYIWEVAFLHRQSRTLILTDLVELIGDNTPNVNGMLKFWWKAVFRMWNKASPAPEYRLGWKDKEAALMSLERILAWDFERVIIGHGDLIERDAKQIVREAWEIPLSIN